MNIYDQSKVLKHDGIYVIEFIGSYVSEVLQKHGEEVINIGYIKNECYYTYDIKHLHDLTLGQPSNHLIMYNLSEITISDYYTDEQVFQEDVVKLLDKEHVLC